jgi:hypothetical protein
LFFFVLGLMSKAMLVTWPLVMLLLDWWPLKRFTIYDSRFTIHDLASDPGEAAVLCPCRGGEHRDLRGATARGSGGVDGNLVLEPAHQ